MLVNAWVVSQLWNFGIWFYKCSIIPKINPIKPKIYLHKGICCFIPHSASTPETKPKFQPSTTVLICFTLTMCLNKKFLSTAMLYVFEDNEVVIKMIIKGRSPIMRHVSRTHRVALDWLFDRINLDPKIQIRYIDTKHQIADMLTKANFTRDECNNLLRLFNISHFSSLCCAKNFSLISCTKTMAERMPEQKEDNRIEAESSQSNGDESGHFCLEKFFICEQSCCVEKSGDTQSLKSTDWILRETWRKIKTKFQFRRSVEF